MNCEHIEEQLTSYLLGDLDPDAVAIVVAHLETCGRCRAVLADIEPTLDCLRDALSTAPRAPEHLAAPRRREIRAALAGPGVRVIRWFGETHTGVTKVAATLVVGAMFLGIFISVLKSTRYATPEADDLPEIRDLESRLSVSSHEYSSYGRNTTEGELAEYESAETPNMAGVAVSVTPEPAMPVEDLFAESFADADESKPNRRDTGWVAQQIMGDDRAERPRTDSPSVVDAVTDPTATRELARPPPSAPADELRRNGHGDRTLAFRKPSPAPSSGPRLKGAAGGRVSGGFAYKADPVAGGDFGTAHENEERDKKSVSEVSGERFTIRGLSSAGAPGAVDGDGMADGFTISGTTLRERGRRGARAEKNALSTGNKQLREHAAEEHRSLSEAEAPVAQSRIAMDSREPTIGGKFVESFGDLAAAGGEAGQSSGATGPREAHPATVHPERAQPKNEESTYYGYRRSLDSSSDQAGPAVSGELQSSLEKSKDRAPQNRTGLDRDELSLGEVKRSAEVRRDSLRAKKQPQKPAESQRWFFSDKEAQDNRPVGGAVAATAPQSTASESHDLYLGRNLQRLNASESSARKAEHVMQEGAIDLRYGVDHTVEVAKSVRPSKPASPPSGDGEPSTVDMSAFDVMESLSPLTFKGLYASRSERGRIEVELAEADEEEPDDVAIHFEEDEQREAEDTGARFKAYGVNPFYAVADRKFSTFAIDVDTAAYTLARRHMLQGKLPPAEAVRTEEFVNAFDYDYNAPAGRTFEIYSETAPTPFGRGLHLVKIGVKGKRLGREQQRHAVLTLVIDSSGSMNTPDRLGLLRRSLAMLVEKLGPADRIAVVQYDSKARLVLDHTPVAEKEAILAAINGVQTSGSTNLEEGLKLGFQIASRGFSGGGENRVLLLSDGMANLGATEAGDILDAVQAYRKQGIRCSVFGFGVGPYNDEMLEKLANRGDGAYVFIDSPEEARRVFVDDLAATLHVIASDVKIQVEFNPDAVVRYRQLGYENRQLRDEDFRNDAVDAGEVGSGQAVTALYEVELKESSRNEDLATVRVRYRDAATQEVEEIESAVRPTSIAARFEDAPTRFRLAAAVAEFSELLRGSPHATGSEYGDVARVLRPVALELNLDQRVQELLYLIQSAEGMPRAVWSNDRASDR